jgi:hypothetical protein
MEASTVPEDITGEQRIEYEHMHDTGLLKNIAESMVARLDPKGRVLLLRMKNSAWNDSKVWALGAPRSFPAKIRGVINLGVSFLSLL